MELEQFIEIMRRRWGYQWPIPVYVGPEGDRLPSNPTDGDLAIFVPNDTNEIRWLLQYDAGGAANKPWVFLGGAAHFAVDSTSRSITSTGSGTTLTAAVPSTAISIPLYLQGDYQIRHTAWLTPPGATTSNWTLAAVGGGGISPISHDFCIIKYGANGASTAGRQTSIDTRIVTDVTSPITPYGQVSGGTGNYLRAEVGITPVRVGNP